MKALNEGKSEEKSIAYADSVVRLTQSSGASKDLARIQRGPEILKLFTMYYSYFNNLYNLVYRAVDMPAKNHFHKMLQLASFSLLVWIAPALLGESASGRGPDDDEEWATWAFMNIVNYPFNVIPIVRDAVSSRITGFDYKITPIESFFEKALRLPNAYKKAYEEENISLAIRPTFEISSVLFKIPSGQADISLGNLYDYLTGESDFELRDLLFRRPQSRR